MIKIRKAMSNVVSTTLLVLLAIVAVGIVWTTVRGMIDDNISAGEACNIEILDKVTINSKYTCYNEISKQFQFSINLGEIDLDYLLISIDGGGSSKSFKINNIETIIPHVTNYPDNLSNVKLPEQNSGKTYYVNITTIGILVKPDSIKIAPTIDGNQCEQTDSLFEIDGCEALV